MPMARSWSCPMYDLNRWRFGLALALTAGLAGCNGKPEDLGQGGASSQAATSTSPAPPYPAWANAMIGKDLKQVSQGTAVCKGAIDLVSAKHTGAHPGSEIEGWAWNEKEARPVAKVVFTNAGDRIVGAATEGNPRTDVVAVVPEVKSPAVGWKGVSGTTSGSVTAVGLTDSGASCVLGSTNL